MILETCSDHPHSLLAATCSPKPMHNCFPQQDAVKDCLKEDFHLCLPEGFLGGTIPKCAVSTGLEAVPITQVFLSHSSVVMEEGSAAAQSVVSEGGEKSI